MQIKPSKKEILKDEPLLDEIDREPIEREKPDDPVAEHDDREWKAAVDNRIE